MKQELKGLFRFLFLTVTLGLAVVAYNVIKDPLCFFCEEVDLQKVTLNRHYQVAQLMKASPETQQIVLGSSRGETTSARWLKERTGLSTLNLSIAGGGMMSKDVFVKMAQKNLIDSTTGKPTLQKVIWLADYFEFSNVNAENNILNTPALRKWLSQSFQDSSQPLFKLKTLIDHNTFEASLAAQKKTETVLQSQEPGSEINVDECLKESYAGKISGLVLDQEVQILYDRYTRGVLNQKQSEAAWEVLKALAVQLAEKGIRLDIVVTPYHPEFRRKLKSEFSEIWRQHEQWVQRLESLQELSGVRVFDFLESIPEDSGSPADWNDGVHFSCRLAGRLLEKTFNK